MITLSTFSVIFNFVPLIPEVLVLLRRGVFQVRGLAPDCFLVGVEIGCFGVESFLDGREHLEV